MTEAEKLAEKYVANKADKGNFDVEQFGKAYFSESSMKQAFIAGYEAGKPKWHKVADGELPPLSKEVYIACTDGETGFDKWLGEEWFISNNNEVVAWCEIPRLEEE